MSQHFHAEIPAEKFPLKTQPETSSIAIAQSCNRSSSGREYLRNLVHSWTGFRHQKHPKTLVRWCIIGGTLVVLLITRMIGGKSSYFLILAPVSWSKIMLRDVKSGDNSRSPELPLMLHLLSHLMSQMDINRDSKCSTTRHSWSTRLLDLHLRNWRIVFQSPSQVPWSLPEPICSLADKRMFLSSPSMSPYCGVNQCIVFTSVAGPSSNPQVGCYVVLEQILVWKDPSNYKDIYKDS